MKAENSIIPSEGQFNTLAQIGTPSLPHVRGKRPVLVKGNGSEILNPTTLRNRAKKKTITQVVILALIDIANKRDEPEWVRKYWNTYHCQNQIICTAGRSHGNYCKNRFCTLCAGNRKAEMINKYLPVVAQWQEPYMVTLTARAVPACRLKSRIDRMLLSIEKILARNKKRHHRGTGTKLEGIRALECNFNPQRRTYNPHFHLIVSSRSAAELITREWLEQCTRKFASPLGQYMRAVEDTIHDMVEVIKYGSKIFTDPTMQKGKTKATPFVYVSALHNMILAMEGHRVFERFGFNLPKYIKPSVRNMVTDYEQLYFKPELCDWINEETRKELTGYKPSLELLAILNQNMDLILN